MLDQDNLSRTGEDRSGVLAGRAVELCIEAVRSDEQASARREVVFAELDEILETADAGLVEEISEDPRYRDIQQDVHRVRAEYEYEREYLLAEEIIQANSETPALAFRSADWYEQATDFEMAALAGYQLKRMLFVGAGPFPTSPFSYMRADPEVSVTCLDRSDHAGGVALQIAGIFGFDGLEMISSDVLEFTDYGDYDCVMIGLVVGTSLADKNRIVDHLKTFVPPTTLLTFRTAVGSGTIIYPSVDFSRFDGADYQVLPDPPHKSFTMALINPARSSS